ncbi:MAG: NUDIX domain-containing protein [Patescibacteria group bacterium]|nr:NUDIX domain-containing protein [Patescibacteria group bacterium]MDE1966133.1 NUDIX domain-containing protein [Patescibacteria group bacterium]
MPHLHEKIDFTASVYVVNDGAVLLHLHQKTGKWLPVGGHVELDEDPNQAVLREAKEESGLTIRLIGELPDRGEDDGHRELLPPRFMNRHRFLPGGAHEHVDLVYFGRAKTRAVNPAKSEAETEYRWFTDDELDAARMVLPTIRRYAKAALEAAARES